MHATKMTQHNAVKAYEHLITGTRVSNLCVWSYRIQKGLSVSSLIHFKSFLSHPQSDRCVMTSLISKCITGKAK